VTLWVAYPNIGPKELFGEYFSMRFSMFATRITARQATHLAGKKCAPEGVSIGVSLVVFVHHNPLSQGHEGGTWVLMSPTREEAIKLLTPK
jgi:hypothetical protein